MRFRPPWRKRACERARTLCILSRDGPTVVGIVNGMTDGEVTYLCDLYVLEKYRGQGRGKELLQQFLKAAEGTTIVLLTSEASGFYEKFGFVRREAMVWKGDK